jgi:hypothetical protein
VLSSAGVRDRWSARAASLCGRDPQSGVQRPHVPSAAARSQRRARAAIEQIACAQREGVLFRTADDEPEVLQKAADLIFEIALDLDEQRPAGHQRLDGVAIEALTRTSLYQPVCMIRDADGVIAVALVDLAPRAPAWCGQATLRASWRSSSDFASFAASPPMTMPPLLGQYAPIDGGQYHAFIVHFRRDGRLRHPGIRRAPPCRRRERAADFGQRLQLYVSFPLSLRNVEDLLQLADDWQSGSSATRAGRRVYREDRGCGIIQLGTAWTRSPMAYACYAAPTVRDSGFKWV